MKSELQIGKILKPRGLDGEFKVEFYSSNTSRFSSLKKLSIDGTEHKVSKISIQGVYGFIKLADILDCDSAEKLRGKVISAKREDLPKLEEGKHYIVDIIGLDVIVSGDVIGEIIDVLQYGSADVYVVKTKDSSLSFPALKQLIRSIDLEKGEMVLDDQMFYRVAVFDDK